MKQFLLGLLTITAPVWALGTADDGLVRSLDGGDVVESFAGECVQAYWVGEDLRGACRGQVRVNANFDTDEATLKRSDKRQIQEAAKSAKYGNETIEVKGYADFTGSEAHNKELSQRRSQAAKSVLQRAGVKASKIKASGEGVAEPRSASPCAELSGSELENCLAKDRRVEVEIQAR